jgi:hypothetical protein
MVGVKSRFELEQALDCFVIIGPLAPPVIRATKKIRKEIRVHPWPEAVFPVTLRSSLFAG